jgi:hypothetical protein
MTGAEDASPDPAPPGGPHAIAGAWSSLLRGDQHVKFLDTLPLD